MTSRQAILGRLAPSTQAKSEPSSGPFKTFGEQLLAIYNAASSEPDPRLYGIQNRAATLGGSETVPTDGGFAMQPEFTRQIIERLYLTGEIFSRCTQIPIKTNGLKFPQFDESSRATGSRLGGLQTYVIDERNTPIPTTLQMAGYAATSGMSLTVAKGTLTLSVQANLSYVTGVRLSITSTSSPNNFMHGRVVTYSGSTLVVDVDVVSGAGTFTSWAIAPLDIAAVLAQKPAFFQGEIVPSKIAGLLYLTSELSRDTDAFDSWASYAFSQELLFQLENLIVNGTGAGQPLGVMNSGALVSIAKATGQQAGTVVSTNINTMLASFWSASYNSPGAVWLYNQQLLPQLSTLSTIVGTAGSESKLWQWCASEEGYDRLAGFPAIQSEYCSVPGTPGDLILCDFSRYIIAMRELLRGEVSIQVKFLTDQEAFRFIMRVGGQPIDRVPVTPLNGTVATSPFVALQQR